MRVWEWVSLLYACLFLILHLSLGNIFQFSFNTTILLTAISALFRQQLQNLHVIGVTDKRSFPHRGITPHKSEKNWWNLNWDFQVRVCKSVSLLFSIILPFLSSQQILSHLWNSLFSLIPFFLPFSLKIKKKWWWHTHKV